MRQANQKTKINLTSKHLQSLSKHLYNAMDALHFALQSLHDNYQSSSLNTTNLALRQTLGLTLEIKRFSSNTLDLDATLKPIDHVLMAIDEQLLNYAVINRQTPALAQDTQQLIESLTCAQKPLLNKLQTRPKNIAANDHQAA